MKDIVFELGLMDGPDLEGVRDDVLDNIAWANAQKWYRCAI